VGSPNPSRDRAIERTAAELRALGAPDALVQWCLDAVEDERRHAAACLAVAERLDGRAVTLGAVDPGSPRDLDLAQLAVKTLLEGAMPETVAAAEAWLAAERCMDPEIRAVLETIAAEEQDHAELGWAIIGWARAMGGREVDEALAVALSAEPWPVDAEPRDDALGRLGATARQAVLDTLFADVFAPLRALLDARPAQQAT